MPNCLWEINKSVAENGQNETGKRGDWAYVSAFGGRLEGIWKNGGWEGKSQGRWEARWKKMERKDSESQKVNEPNKNQNPKFWGLG